MRFPKFEINQGRELEFTSRHWALYFNNFMVHVPFQPEMSRIPVRDQFPCLKYRSQGMVVLDQDLQETGN